MQNDRITLLELQNKNQDDGIQFLKSETSEHLSPNICQMNQNRPNNMIKRKPFYPTTEKENGDAADDVNQHVIRQEKQRRPARLLPLQLLTYQWNDNILNAKILRNVIIIVA